MKVGFNTNIPYKGKTYHVQTEDCGLSNPHILTLLYYEGAILASRRTSYEPFIGRPDCSQKIQELMNLQHKLMMKELIAGKHTPSADSAPEEGKAEEKCESRPAPEQARGTQTETGSGAERTTTPAAPEPGPSKPGNEGPEQKMKSVKDAGSDKGQMVNSLDDVLINFILRNKQE